MWKNITWLQSDIQNLCKPPYISDDKAVTAYIHQGIDFIVIIHY